MDDIEDGGNDTLVGLNNKFNRANPLIVEEREMSFNYVLGTCR